jgi:hypothetical protein
MYTIDESTLVANLLIAMESSFLRIIFNRVVLVLETRFRGVAFSERAFADEETAAGISPRVRANLNIPPRK